MPNFANNFIKTIYKIILMLYNKSVVMVRVFVVSRYPPYLNMGEMLNAFPSVVKIRLSSVMTLKERTFSANLHSGYIN